MRRVRRTSMMFGMVIMMLAMSLPVYADTVGVVNEQDEGFTAKEIEEFKNCEDTDMVLVSKVIKVIDDEVYAEIKDYEEDLTEGRATTHKVNRKRTYELKSKGAVMVRFVLYGKFKYNGKTSSCLDSYVLTTNNKTSLYAILNESSNYSGNSATGYCYTQNKKTKKVFGGTFRITVSANGSTKYI